MRKSQGITTASACSTWSSFPLSQYRSAPLSSPHLSEAVDASKCQGSRDTPCHLPLEGVSCHVPEDGAPCSRSGHSVHVCAHTHVHMLTWGKMGEESNPEAAAFLGVFYLWDCEARAHVANSVSQSANRVHSFYQLIYFFKEKKSEVANKLI